MATARKVSAGTGPTNRPTASAANKAASGTVKAESSDHPEGPKTVEHGVKNIRSETPITQRELAFEVYRDSQELEEYSARPSVLRLID